MRHRLEVQRIQSAVIPFSSIAILHTLNDKPSLFNGSTNSLGPTFDAGKHSRCNLTINELRFKLGYYEHTFPVFIQTHYRTFDPQPKPIPVLLLSEKGNHALTVCPRSLRSNYLGHKLEPSFDALQLSLSDWNSSSIIVTADPHSNF